MSESELRPRVFVVDLIQPGDIVLTTTPEPISKAIRNLTASDISHAMICVDTSSVIDSTGDGVHARNLGRIILEPGCAGHVLRPVKALSTDQMRSVLVFARGAVGTRYTTTGAAKSALAGFVAGRRQFCSRLVAQAYRDAGVNLVLDADFCHPGELLKSEALIEVQNVLRNLSPEEELGWREAIDYVQAMRDSTNALLHDARKLSTEIESLNDINAYLIKHPESDARLVQALQSSRYLDLWRDEFERNSWQYNVAMMEGHKVSAEHKKRYCEALLSDEKLSPNRFIVNRAGFTTLNRSHPRQYFALMMELYDTLAHFHDRRINAATAWLQRKGLFEPIPLTPLRPHTAEWFAALREWDPDQAAMTEVAIKTAENSNVCGICADDPACDYVLINKPAGGPGTFRLCEFCFGTRSLEEPMKPF